MPTTYQVTSTPTTIAVAGLTSAEVTNTGSDDVFLSPGKHRLRPGQTRIVSPTESALTVTGSGSVSVATGAAVTSFQQKIASDAALTGTYALKGEAGGVGNDAVCMGDSITAYGGSETMAPSWFNQLCIRSLGRIRWRGIYATGGYKIQDLITVHVPAVLALTPKPNTAIIMIGANDCSENGGVGFDLAAKTALYESGIIQPMLAAGIRPVLCMVTPNDGSTGGVTAISNNVAALNAWIRIRSRRLGTPCLDSHSPLVNPADGSMLTIFRGTGGTDHVHPSPAGHRAIAEYNLPGLLPSFPAAPQGVSSFPETYNLVPTGTGLFNSDSNSDGLANGWSVGGSPTGFTRAVVAATTSDNLVGSWQQATRTTTDTNAAWIFQQISTGWSVGDLLEYSIRVQTDGFSGSGATWASYVKPGNLSNSYGAVNSWSEDVVDGLLTVRFTVPAGATSLYVYAASITVPTSGTVRMRVGQATLRNLTTMGLATV